jgi:hypothetical protein
MMKQDKFLIGIMTGILVLVLVAVGVYFIRKTTLPTFQPEDQPAGVVNNYILAIRNQDYARAYGYLTDKTGKPSQTGFRQALLINKEQIEQAIVDIGDSNINATSAIVEVVAQNSYNEGIFTSAYENKENAILENVDGKWKITSMPYLFWSYDWYQVVK